MLDGQRLGKADVAATVVRTKLADLWSCPKCSGMWGGMICALAVSHWWFGFGWLVVVAAQVAGWGVARRVGWSA
jgi:hypothetical protein